MAYRGGQPPLLFPISSPFMNKLIDAMLAEISPEVQADAHTLIMAVAGAIETNHLLPEKIRGELPARGATEGEADPMAIVKFFTPDGRWTWYATEFDGDDTFFGLVKGLEDELGYFSLSELRETGGNLGLPVERDLYFEPTKLSELR